MFYGQCNACGERWSLGTASTCKCPKPDKWVGLTEEETQALYDRYAVYQEYGAEDSGWFDFARAIEAWLREKNT
jgi:hypothetical protein